MRYYQVNQDYQSRHEFISRYLCAPDQEHFTHRFLREMQVGDLIFNQYSRDGVIFGLSRVVPIGDHKGDLSDPIIDRGGSWLVYKGEHLSLKHMSEAKRKDQDKYENYIEVHTEIILDKTVGPNLFPGMQIYANEIDSDRARELLERCGLTYQGKPAFENKTVRRPSRP